MGTGLLVPGVRHGEGLGNPTRAQDVRGTHQGAVSREHLDYYLEFTFRFNRRTSRHRGKLFYRLLEQAVAVDPVPYAAMVKGLRGPRRRRYPNRS